MDSSIVAWPPSYTIKKSSKAKHVRLKASVKHGLELVTPTRFNTKEIPAILEKNRSWIEKQLAQIQSQISVCKSDILPNEIIFTNPTQIWKIEYLESDTKFLRLITRPRQFELVLFGNISNIHLCKNGLMTWSKNQAKKYLANLLSEISEEIKLPFQSVTIRDQSTLWGSCSAKKVINLNYKLLFLPPEITRYVLIHELCHTIHLNHSEKFWQLVEKFDPQWKMHRNALRNAWQYLPGWTQ